MRPALKYTLSALLWGGVAAYIYWAATASQADRSTRTVERVEIDVVDSTSQGHLVTSAEVRKWLAAERIEPVGKTTQEVDLAAIERLIARNGFVERAAAYVTRSGELHIDIRQRKPLLRLLTEGENAYVTASGFVFAAPRASSLYVPVVTGSYRPPFPKGYTGDVWACMETETRRIATEIEALEAEKLPVHREERDDYDNWNQSRRRTVKWWWKYLEDDAEYAARLDRMRADKQRLRREYRYRARIRQQRLDCIEARQEEKRHEQKKLAKNYEDFLKLLTFVKSVEADDFWSAEIVQIVARTSPSGALEIDLIPRSGGHRIRFGRLERTEEKLDKSLRFYRKGLSRIGWEQCRVVDVRYRDQVVCR
ncbi:MAG: hypothetical protein NC250_09725 [Alistipes senegalensis]|nr:hypothetical protein [Bacteroides cellulosilyticus]MCM1352992.1 hypothetical protein [Alistipes senegalensis]